MRCSLSHPHADIVAGVLAVRDSKPQMNLLPMQPGDVHSTCADTGALQRNVGWQPTTAIEEGLPRLVQWYRGYYENRALPPDQGAASG